MYRSLNFTLFYFQLNYRYLVIALGMQLNYNKVQFVFITHTSTSVTAEVTATVKKHVLKRNRYNFRERNSVKTVWFCFSFEKESTLNSPVRASSFLL